MKKLSQYFLAALVVLGLVAYQRVVRADDTAAPKSAAELEKEKALANPYPNDLGPAELPKEVLASYPADIQEGYKLLRGDAKHTRCQTCHTSSRPLNSRFVETSGKDLAERQANLAKIKADHPEMFGEKAAGIWQIEADVWQRYVKRMMSKPGCNIEGPDGKKIWAFLVYDGNHRKIGAKAAEWKAHQEDLLKQFKDKYPKRYDELKGQDDL